jgi:hypothetical protein
VKLNGIEYYYICGTQGNIIALIDAVGFKVAAKATVDTGKK